MQEHSITRVETIEMQGLELKDRCILYIIITNKDGHETTIKLLHDNVRLITSFNGKRVWWQKDLAA